MDMVGGNTMNANDFVKLLDEGYEFSEEEMEQIIYDCSWGWNMVDEVNDERGRWSQHQDRITTY